MPHLRCSPCLPVSLETPNFNRGHFFNLTSGGTWGIKRARRGANPFWIYDLRFTRARSGKGKSRFFDILKEFQVSSFKFSAGLEGVCRLVPLQKGAGREASGLRSKQIGASPN